MLWSNENTFWAKKQTKYSSASVLEVRSRERHDTYVWRCWRITRCSLPTTVNKARRTRLYIEKKLFLFFFTQKVFSLLHNIPIEPLMSHGLLWQCFWYLSGPWMCKDPCCLWKDQKALGLNPKHLNLCSEDEWRSYGFGTTWGWVINDRMFIFGWTIPLMSIIACSWITSEMNRTQNPSWWEHCRWALDFILQQNRKFLNLPQKSHRTRERDRLDTSKRVSFLFNCTTQTPEEQEKTMSLTFS